MPANDKCFQTVSYGGGARWFMKKHLAFSLDVRSTYIGGGTPELGYPASPGTVLFVIAAGEFRSSNALIRLACNLS